MHIVQILEICLGALATILVFVIGGAIKINRQVETLETKMEQIEKDMNRYESEHKEIKSMFSEIKEQIADLKILLAGNGIRE